MGGRGSLGRSVVTNNDGVYVVEESICLWRWGSTSLYNFFDSYSRNKMN